MQSPRLRTLHARRKKLEPPGSPDGSFSLVHAAAGKPKRISLLAETQDCQATWPSWSCASPCGGLLLRALPFFRPFFFAVFLAAFFLAARLFLATVTPP